MSQPKPASTDKLLVPATSSSGKIMSKLNDGLGLMSNSLSQGFVKAARLFSTEVMARPKNAWPNNDSFELEGVTCPPDVVEAMFDFVAVVPQLDGALIERIYKLVFQKDVLSFVDFVKALHNVLHLRPRRARLGLIFMILVGERMGDLSRDLSLEVVATHLQSSMRFMGYGEKDDAREVMAAWEKALWPGGLEQTTKSFSYSDFVMLPVEDTHFVLDFFGFFDFLSALAHGRLEGRSPQKEGFLRKSFSNVAVKERWKAHWSVCRDGFFWYFTSDDSTFAQPARVLKLQRDSRVELICETVGTEGECYGFCLTQGSYGRKFLCSSKAAAENWVSVVQENCKSSFQVRVGSTCRWMVDGKDTFEEIRKAIRWAKREIFITSWFFCAHVFIGSGERLDTVLQEKAAEGVRVYLLLWNETKLTLDLNSHFSETYMESLHPNIKVMRHPTVTPMKWSHHQKTVVVDQRVAFVGGLDLGLGRLDDQRHICTDENKLNAVWKGKDYYNPSFVPIQKVEFPFEDSLDRSTQPRMPWHDVHSVTDGTAAQDVAQAFIERWNHHKECLAKDLSYPYLVPCDSMGARRGNMRVRVLRSVCNWSTGVSITESSIYEAYLDVIAKSEHFIYIENQFFISSLAGADVQNTIVDAIMTRVLLAMAKKEVFRVVVVLPVTPEGDWEHDEAIRHIMLWQQRTIKAFMAQLKEKSKESDDVVAQYVSFHSLRSFGTLSSGKRVTEQIYVHSKLIIVDDRFVIVGSANINDRSMLGDRDSEICLYIEDSVLEQCVFNGNHYNVSRFAHSLRVALWQEHLGLSPKDASVEDPVCADTHELWRVRSHMNTTWFEFNFPDIPSDRLKTLAACAAAKGTMNIAGTIPVSGLQGSLVDHPIEFLADEKLMYVTGAAGAAVGSDVFV